MGRPPASAGIAVLIEQLVIENPSGGYKKIQGIDVNPGRVQLGTASRPGATCCRRARPGPGLDPGFHRCTGPAVTLLTCLYRSRVSLDEALRVSCAWDLQGDHGTAAGMVARRCLAAVGVRDGAHDGQAQAGPAVAPGAPGIRAGEPLEGGWQELGGETGTVVADLDDQVGAGCPGRDQDGSSGRGEAQRVVDQVIDRLGYRSWRAVHRLAYLALACRVHSLPDRRRRPADLVAGPDRVGIRRRGSHRCPRTPAAARQAHHGRLPDASNLGAGHLPGKHPPVMRGAESRQHHAGAAGTQRCDRLPRLLPAGLADGPASLAGHCARYGRCRRLAQAIQG